jgi:hypothetical protein
VSPLGTTIPAGAECDVEELAVLHFAELGYKVVHTPHIAPETSTTALVFLNGPAPTTIDLKNVADEGALLLEDARGLG